jgi:hypothetical protein
MSSDTPRHPLPLLPHIPLRQLYWRGLPDRFTDQTVRWICSDLADVEFVTLCHPVSVFVSAIREDLFIDIMSGELSQAFGHSGSRAQGMMARYEQDVQTSHFLSRGRPRLVE